MICSERVTLLPLELDDATRLREIRATPTVSRWWGTPESKLPDDEPEATRFAMLDGEKLARMIHYGEENTPEYRHATIDLFGDPARRGRAPETIEALVAHLAGERGQHRIAIDPALANEAAILAYEKAGFAGSK
jgi:aminoglycoside 6'-N-acetyltransferase